MPLFVHMRPGPKNFLADIARLKFMMRFPYVIGHLSPYLLPIHNYQFIIALTATGKWPQGMKLDIQCHYNLT